MPDPSVLTPGELREPAPAPGTLPDLLARFDTNLAALESTRRLVTALRRPLCR